MVGACAGVPRLFDLVNVSDNKLKLAFWYVLDMPCMCRLLMQSTLGCRPRMHSCIAARK